MVFGPIFRPHIKSLLLSYALYIVLTITVNHFYKKSLSKYAFKTHGLSLQNMPEELSDKYLKEESNNKCLTGDKDVLFTESASFTEGAYYIEIKLFDNVTTDYSCSCVSNCFVTYDSSKTIINRGCDYTKTSNGTFTGWFSGHVVFKCGKYSNYMDEKRLGKYLSQFTLTVLLVNFSKGISWIIAIIVLILGFLAPCAATAENKSGLGRRLSAYNIQRENTSLENSIPDCNSNEELRLAGEILTNKSKMHRDDSISKMMRKSDSEKRNSSKTSRRSHRRGSVIETKDILRQMKESRIDRHVNRNRSENLGADEV